MSAMAQATATAEASHMEVESRLATGYQNAETPNAHESVDAALAQLQRALARPNRIHALAAQRRRLAQTAL